MKKVIVLLMMIATMGLQAQNKNAKSSIEVDGVCGMCKVRIEKAALNTKGVKSAVWNIESHMLSLIFDERKTHLDTIHQKIANVGHDTKKVTATEEAYLSVHECCRYRDEEVKDHHNN
ncbi:MAG: heavy-metal-associated domain-containing protein [Bacteroidota bacterium]